MSKWWMILPVLAVLAIIVRIAADPVERTLQYREWIESPSARERRETAELEQPYRPAAVRPLPAQGRKYARSLYLENLPVGRWAFISKRAVWKAGGWHTDPGWRVFLRARMDKKSANGWSNGGKLVDDPDWSVVVEHTSEKIWTVWLEKSDFSSTRAPSDRPPLAFKEDWALATAVSAVLLPSPVDGK